MEIVRDVERAYRQLTPPRELDDAQLEDNYNATALSLRVTYVKDDA